MPELALLGVGWRRGPTQSPPIRRGCDPHPSPTPPTKYMQINANICNVSSPPGPAPARGEWGEPHAKARTPGVSYTGRDETRLKGALLEGPRAGEPPRRPAPRGSWAMLLPSPGRCCRLPVPQGPFSESRSGGRHPGAARGVSGPAPGTRGQHSGAPPAESPEGGRRVTGRSPGHAPTSTRPAPGYLGQGWGHAPPGSQASSRGEAKDSALLSSRDAGLLEPPEAHWQPHHTDFLLLPGCP